jgi:predicted dehydrogenase
MTCEVSIALIGLGVMGFKLLETFNEICKITCVVIRDNPKSPDKTTKIRKLQREYPHIRIVCDFKDLLRDDSIEAVVIATPIDSHYKLCKDFLLSGKHVFLEKPISKNLAECIELKDIALRNQLTLHIGYKYIYDLGFQELCKRIEREKIRWLNLSWFKWGSFKEDISWNLASHELLLALTIFPEITSIERLDSESSLNSFRLSDNNKMLVLLRTNNGYVGSININRLSNAYLKTIQVETDNNVFVLNGEELIDYNKINNIKTNLFKNKSNMLNLECADFINCIEFTKTPLVNIDMSIQVTKILQNYNESKN